jgi:transposase
MSWYKFAVEYMDARWSQFGGISRKNIAKTLTATTIGLLQAKPAQFASAAVRTALREWAFNTNRRPDAPRDVVAILGGRLLPTFHTGTAHRQVAAEHPRVRKVWVDGGYRQHLVEHAAALGIDKEITTRKPGTRGFTPIPKRWAVERTYGWLMLHRRLTRDYEPSPPAPKP